MSSVVGTHADHGTIDLLQNVGDADHQVVFVGDQQLGSFDKTVLLVFLDFGFIRGIDKLFLRQLLDGENRERVDDQTDNGIDDSHGAPCFGSVAQCRDSQQCERLNGKAGGECEHEAVGTHLDSLGAVLGDKGSQEQPVKKKLVLVFDDFERCKIGVIDLLGIINTYVEDKRIKTIVIASEDNIEDEENYKTFKEKVVERTVKLDMEYRRIQQEMIEDYKTETSEYKEFLKKESPKLFQVFEESGSRNLRTFKSCLIDFERVYGLWHSLKLPTDGMGEAL